MIDINKEAEEYSSYDNPYIPLRFGNHDYNETHKETFIAGHNSKATQAKVIQAQIDVLKETELSDYDVEYSNLKEYRNKVRRKITQLQQQLKELEKLL